MPSVKRKNTNMNFFTPPITKHLIIINLLMYLAKVVAVRYGVDFDDLLGLHYFMASDFRLYQFFTYMFVHGGFEHLFFNMFAVWMFGRIMEQVMGSQRFLFYYIVCGLGAGLIQESVQFVEYLYSGLSEYEAVNIGGGMTVSMDSYLNRWTTVGASGAVYGVLLSFGMTFPEERMFIIPIPFPIKAKWFVIGYAVIELLSAMGHSGDGVAHMAHLGGMLFGLALILYWRKHPGNGNHFFGGSSGRNSFFGNGNSGYGNYNQRFTPYEDVTYEKGPSLWQRIKAWMKKQRKPRMDVNNSYNKHSKDMQWRQDKQEREAEIDRILDKVKKGGYESLTQEEKRKLFDASQR